MALPADLRQLLWLTANLTTLQGVDAEQKNRGTPRLCTAAFCRLLLRLRYQLTEDEITATFNKQLTERILEPLDLVVKTASLQMEPAYEQHLYLTASHGLLFALRAQRTDLVHYYLQRIFVYGQPPIDVDALRFYLGRMPNAAACRRAALSAGLVLMPLTLIEPENAAEAALLNFDLTALATVEGLNVRLLPLWCGVITRETVNYLPALRQVLLGLPATVARDFYLAVCDIASGLPIAQLTAINTGIATINKLLQLAYSVGNRVAALSLMKASGIRQHEAGWILASEVVYDPEFFQQGHTGEYLTLPVQTSMFLAGLAPLLNSINGYYQGSKYAYQDNISVVIRMLNSTAKRKLPCIDQGVSRVLFRNTQVIENTAVLVTLEDAVRIMSLVPLTRILFCPVSPTMQQLMLANWPALAAREPPAWQKIVQQWEEPGDYDNVS